MLDQYGANRALSELLPDAVSKIAAAEITAHRTEAAEDVLAEKTRRLTDAADPETIRKIADVLRGLDADHGQTEMAETRSADHRIRDDGDDYGL